MLRGKAAVLPFLWQETQWLHLLSLSIALSYGHICSLVTSILLRVWMLHKHSHLFLPLVLAYFTEDLFGFYHAHGPAFL